VVVSLGADVGVVLSMLNNASRGVWGMVGIDSSGCMVGPDDVVCADTGSSVSSEMPKSRNWFSIISEDFVNALNGVSMYKSVSTYGADMCI